MNKIAVIYMGGTFGCIGEPLSPMPATTFIAHLQQHFQPHYPHANFFAADCIKDSTELTAVEWLQLAQQIQTLRCDYTHFVVIHGTDTLNYACAFLSHLFQDQLRIIFTGSQFPLLNVSADGLHPASDAWTNLNFALEQVLAVKQGVHLAFAATLLDPQSSYKQHTHHHAAFLSTDTPTDKKYVIAKDLNIDHQLINKAKTTRLFNYYLSPISTAETAKNLASLVKNPPDILILQCFGSGNLAQSAEIKAHLQALIQQQCWVIISTQVLFGELAQHYATGSWLADLNVAFDPHFGQADCYARAILLYLQHHNCQNWQQYWN